MRGVGDDDVILGLHVVGCTALIYFGLDLCDQSLIRDIFRNLDVMKNNVLGH